MEKIIYRHCERWDDNENKPISQEEFEDSHWKCSGYGEGGECQCPCHSDKRFHEDIKKIN